MSKKKDKDLIKVEPLTIRLRKCGAISEDEEVRVVFDDDGYNTSFSLWIYGDER